MNAKTLEVLIALIEPDRTHLLRPGFAHVPEAYPLHRACLTFEFLKYQEDCIYLPDGMQVKVWVCIWFTGWVVLSLWQPEGLDLRGRRRFRPGQAPQNGLTVSYYIVLYLIHIDAHVIWRMCSNVISFDVTFPFLYMKVSTKDLQIEPDMEVHKIQKEIATQ